MIKIFSLSLLILFGIIVCELNVDLSSIYMDPDLHRLCWKQFTDKSVADILKLNNAPVRNLKKYKNLEYCLEKEDSSTYKLEIMLNSKEKFILNINFILPLAPAMPVIRKKVVYDGVHFQLNNNFAGLSPTISTDCQLVLIYESKQKKNQIRYFTLNSTVLNTKIPFDKVYEGIPFKVYYSCNFNPAYSTSSAFIMDKGSIYASQNVALINPFIQFPFRQVFIVQWSHPKYFPEAYVVAVYELDETFNENCLKLFRLFSDNRKGEISKSKRIIPSNCDKHVIIEDLGYYQNNITSRMYAVLSMDVPLKFKTRHKLSISWKSSKFEAENNFIYFEPLQNLNSGKIDKDWFYKGFDAILGSTPPLYQEISRNPYELFKEAMITNTGFQVLPVLGYCNTPRVSNTVQVTYKKIYEICDSDRDCKLNTVYPFFYLLLDQNYFYEIIPVSKNEHTDLSPKIEKLEFNANNHNSTFFISWTVTPYSIVQSLYVVQVLDLKSKNLSMVYILKCRTCSGKQKQISEEALLDLRRKYLTIKVFENYYEAGDRKISFNTDEMAPEILYAAKVFSYYLKTPTHERESTPGFIKLSFWNLYGTVIICIISLVCTAGIFIGIFFWCRNLFVNDLKEIEKEDSNKYYGEDDV